MKRRHDPIAVRMGQGPMQFVWHGRLYRVTEIQGQWSRSAQWWMTPELIGDLLDEQEVWRVEAGTSAARRGIYELTHAVGDEEWFLTGVHD